MPQAMARSLALASEALQAKRQAVICDRVGSAPEKAAEYVKVAGELGEAAARCPLAPSTANKAAQLATAAESLAGAAAASSRNVARAIALYKRAASGLQEAAALCPDSHPNKAALEDHASEINVRVIYLESLSGAPATIPIEDHIGDLVLEGLSEQDVPVGEAEEALCPPGAPAPCGPAAPEPPQPEAAPVLQRRDSGPGGGSTASAPGPDTAAPGKKDFLQEATKMERTARDLEDRGQTAQALSVYKDCLQLYSYVLKRDPRMDNPKIKQMVRGRLEELVARAEVLKAQEILNG